MPPEPVWVAFVAAAGMLAAATAAGHAIIVVLRLERLTVPGLAAAGLGLGLVAHAWFLFGRLGWYRPHTAWSVWIAGAVGVGILVALRLRVGWKWRPDLAGPEWLLVGVMTALGAAMLFGALVPPFAIDTIRHHFNAAELFVREGRLTFPPIGLYGQPMAGEMFYVWGLLLSGPLAGKLVVAAHGLLAVVALGLLASRRGGRLAGLFAAGIVISMTLVWYFPFEGKVDLVLLLHVALALLYLDVWIVEGATCGLILGAVFAGFAASAKTLGLFALAAFGVVVVANVFSAPSTWRRRLGSVAAFATLALVAGSPWYLRAWLDRGDPVWPMLGPWLGGAEAAPVYRQAGDWLEMVVPLGRGPGGSVVGLGGLIAGAPVLFGRSLIGPLLLCGLPLLALDSRTVRRGAWLAVFSLTYYVVWFSTSQQGRYLLPAALALTVLAAVGLSVGHRQHGVGAWAVRGAVGGWMAISLLLALWQVLAFAPVVIGGEALDAFLTRTTSFHADIQWMNTALPADAVVGSDYAGLYYLQRRSIWLADDFQGFVDYERIRDVEALRQALRRWSVTHLFLTIDGADEAADPPAALRHALAARCGTVMYRNPAAVSVTSVLLGRWASATASVVALGACRA